jgi:peptidoglycan hydrolase-like protein with peptidoglycan-binding domain
MKILNSLKLRSSFVLKAGAIAAIMAMTIPAISQAAMLYRQLEVGSVGNDVSDLQTFLSIDRTIYPQALVTGYFGQLTKTAVSNFQRVNGISVVGRVGPITMAAINAQMNSDVDAPIINSLNLNTSSSGATINWNTNEVASAKVFYSASPIVLTEASQTTGVGISGYSVIANSNLTTSHSGYIGGLQSNTVYNYVVYVRDGAGNETITLPATFRTI